MERHSRTAAQRRPAGSAPAEHAPLYSRASAVLETIAWLLALFGTGITFFGLVYALVGKNDETLLQVFIVALLALTIRAGITVTIGGNSRGEGPADVLQIVRHGKLRRLFMLIASVFVLLWAVSVDWPELRIQSPSKLLIIVLLMALTAVLIAVSAALMTVFAYTLIRTGRTVLTQYEGWNKKPFEGWTPEALTQFATNPVNFRRWDDPVENKISIELAQAYSSRASDTADSWWIAGQLLVLMAGGGLSTGLAFWVTDVRMMVEWWPMAMIATSVLAGGLGFRISLMRVRQWTGRAEAYRQYVAYRQKSEADLLVGASSPDASRWKWRLRRISRRKL